MRSLVTAVAASVLLVSLTACNPFTDPYEDHQRDGGISPSQAEETLLGIEGVINADYGTYEWYSPGEGGLFSSSGMDVVLTVTIDPEYSVDDHEVFLEYLAATAWSVNDHYPKGSVVIQLIGGEDVNYDWQSVAQEVFPGLEGFGHAGSEGYDPEDVEWFVGGRALTIYAEAYGDRFGRWPTDEVEPPDGLLKHEPVTAILYPAITDLTVTISDGERPCYSVRFVRSGQSAQFYGPVTATLVSEDGVELDSDTTSNANYIVFCFDEDDLPDGASVDVSTGEYDGHEFTPVTEHVEVTDR